MTFQQRFGEFRKQANAAGFTAKEWAQIQHARSLQISIDCGSQFALAALAALLEKFTPAQKAKFEELGKWRLTK